MDNIQQKLELKHLHFRSVLEVLFLPSFHPYLEGKDGGEEGVADLEGEGDDARLVVVLDAHRDHVQEDQHEDGDLEPAEEAMTLE